MITKKEILENIDQIKQYIQEIDNKKEKKAVGIAIKNIFTSDIIFQSTKNTYKDAIIEKGDKNLSGADLSDADLSGADLSGADLSGADLSDANLRGANLRAANLRGANLRNANLFNANLSNANLSNANLSDANLSNANLSNAELNCAKFYGKGGTIKLKKSQVEDFLKALGFQVID